MKNVLFSLMLVSVLFGACSKDDDTGSGSGSCALSCKVDGVDWCGSANFRITDLGIAGITTTIGAGNTDMEAVAILFMSDQAGTYDLAGSLASYTTSDRTVYQSTSGTLEITKITDSEISGTFSFEGQASDGSTISITAGSFENLPKQ